MGPENHCNITTLKSLTPSSGDVQCICSWHDATHGSVWLLIVEQGQQGLFSKSCLWVKPTPCEWIKSYILHETLGSPNISGCVVHQMLLPATGEQYSVCVQRDHITGTVNSKNILSTNVRFDKICVPAVIHRVCCNLIHLICQLVFAKWSNLKLLSIF